MKRTATLDEATDTIASLPPEQQQMRVEILRHRQIDGRREDIAQHAQQMIAAYRDGRLRLPPQGVRHEGLAAHIAWELALGGMKNIVCKFTIRECHDERADQKTNTIRRHTLASIRISFSIINEIYSEDWC